MPRFFVWSPDGDGDCLAARLQREGYPVVLRIDEPWCRGNLEGLVPHTQRDPRDDEIVVFGSSKLGVEGDRARQAGRAVVGSASVADRLEMDRGALMRLCERLDIAIPETHRFQDFAAARQLLDQDGGRWVFKPCGNEDASCTYVAKETDDLRLMLDHFARKMSSADFLLQRVVDGQEVSVEGWFDGSDWVDGAWNATLETKRFLPGDIGPATGCSTSTVWAYATEPSWAEALHRRFTETLRRGGYVGPFDLNLIVTPSQMYVLEATPRFGYDAVQNYAELWEHPLGDVLERLARGMLGALEVDTGMVAASVRLSVPPYPSSGKEHRATGDVPVLLDDADWQRLWPSGVRADDGQLYTAATDGVLGALVATGTTLERAVKTLRDAAGRIHVPDLQWRQDVGDGDGTDWQRLTRWGFPVPPAARALVKDAPPHAAQKQRAALLSSPWGVQPFKP
jgi:phosphoribosylamine---glycine ligase